MNYKYGLIAIIVLALINLSVVFCSYHTRLNHTLSQTIHDMQSRTSS